MLKPRCLFNSERYRCDNSVKTKLYEDDCWMGELLHGYDQLLVSAVQMGSVQMIECLYDSKSTFSHSPNSKLELMSDNFENQQSFIIFCD